MSRTPSDVSYSWELPQVVEQEQEDEETMVVLSEVYVEWEERT